MNDCAGRLLCGLTCWDGSWLKNVVVASAQDGGLFLGCLISQPPTISHPIRWRSRVIHKLVRTNDAISI